jgi:anti-sigma factor RsiW
VALSPPVADFARQGFRLAGGRVQKIDGMDMAVVVYRHGAHEIDLFVWTGTGPQLPGSTVRHGYHLVSWAKGDLRFAVVSDMESGEIDQFVHLVQSEPE